MGKHKKSHRNANDRVNHTRSWTLCSAAQSTATISIKMIREASLPGWRSPNLHRCHTAALNHGYRIGLIVSGEGQFCLGLRDLKGKRPALAIAGNNVEFIALALFAQMLALEYIPRGGGDGIQDGDASATV